MKLQKLLKYKDSPPVYTGLRKLIDDWFIIAKPWEAYTTKGWKIFKKERSEKYPIRWFIQDTIPDWWHCNIWWPITRFFYDGLYWGIRYRTTNRNHIIKPKTIKPGYHDPRRLIMHTNFHFLSEFVEFEKKYGHVDWQSSSKYHAIAWYEMNSLYNWWKYERPTREEKLPDLHIDVPEEWGSMWQFNEDYKETDEYRQWRLICNLHNKAEEQFQIDDENNLIRLMKIREYMWH